MTKARQIEEKREYASKVLSERLEAHDESRMAVQEKLHETCEELRAQIDKLEERINNELEEKFTAEDNRLQTALDELRSSDDDNFSKAFQKAIAELLVIQSYEFIERNPDEDNDGNNEDEDSEPEKKRSFDLASLYDLKTERKVTSMEYICFDKRKPTELIPLFTEKGEFSLSFTFFSKAEKEVLKGLPLTFEVEVVIWKKDDDKKLGRKLTNKYTLENDVPVCFRSTFSASTTYRMKMRIVHQEMSTQWSDETEFTMQEFKGKCIWKECPEDVDEKRKYSIDENNPRIATKVEKSDCSIITGNTALPLNKVTSWSIKVLKSLNNDGSWIYIGVAPFSINQNYGKGIYEKLGWFFNCYYSTLVSGPPHNYQKKRYGSKKMGNGECVHTGDSVGIVMDTTKGELSFVLDGMNLGVAYEGIPLDKPLVPCVTLGCKDDSVELDTSEVKENVDASVPVPSNITTKSSTWDTISITWNFIEGVSFYQIEVDESRSWNASITNTFTKRGLHSDTEHTFRVRAVRGNSVSEWSNVMKGRTQEAPEFGGCIWKKCPSYVDKFRKYFVDRNPRIVSMTGGLYVPSFPKGNHCTIIGNTPLPLDQVSSWSIKILKSKENNGYGILIGVAPSDINQNVRNYDKCGWHFNCWNSTLCSGPPHNYNNKEYGPRKGEGECVHTGDSVGVVMDTTKGDLSFVMDDLDLGVAYEGIPRDKPLVPCVLLEYNGDSVELVI